MKTNSLMNRKIFWVRIVLTICAILGVLSCVIRCAFLVRHSLEDQIPQFLQDIAHQNALIIEAEVASKQDVLDSIAREIEYFGKDDKELILSFLDSYVELYDFKRMGIIYPSKMTYTTDGYARQLPDEAYINNVFRGNTEVSDVLMDVLGEEEAINVLAVPVYETGTREVDYILFGTYKTREFRNLLNVEFYDGEGYTLIVKTDGTLVTGPDMIPVDKKNNLFTALNEYAEENESVVNDTQQKMRSGQSGSGFIEYDGGKYFYYMPLDVTADNSSWYMIAVAPEEVLSARVEAVWTIVIRMVLMVMVVGILFGVIYLYTHYNQKKRLIRLAYVDSLTGGDNLACFKDKLKSMKETEGYMISMDMGEFRLVNSICGVGQADELLKRISDILQRHITENELLAHMNADNFVMFLQADGKDELEARLKAVAKELIELTEEMNVPRIVPYFGIAAGNSTDGFVKTHSYAKQAKLSIKGKKNEMISFYDEMDLQQDIENKKLEDSFEKAIKEHEFEVWYQPKFDTQQGTMVGAEALVRWRKDGVLIPPGKFIPLFEKNGMIEALDEYVFREVCRQQKQWQEEGKKLFPVSANISRASLYYADIAAKYRKIANEYGVPLEYVQIEITESATINNGDICTLINEFHNEGFCLLLDDFGNGYSSLSTLNVMHFDILKLDKGLVDHIGDVNGEVLLYHIIKLAQSLGLKITAEGVEYKEQVEYLKKMNCDDIQGYYFSKPLPVNEFEILLKAS